MIPPKITVLYSRDGSFKICEPKLPKGKQPCAHCGNLAQRHLQCAREFFCSDVCHLAHHPHDDRIQA